MALEKFVNQQSMIFIILFNKPGKTGYNTKILSNTLANKKPPPGTTSGGKTFREY